jgi:hypothetical protein
MPSERRHLAQLNIARLLAPIDDPQIDDFRLAIPDVNALGEASRGFVWRLEGAVETGAIDLRWPDAPDDEQLIVNMTVWEDVDCLREFVYRSGHVEIMRRKREWFERMVESHLVLWWVPVGHRPTLLDARDRLDHLRTHGPTPHAFTMRTTFPPDAIDAHAATVDEEWRCPA